MSRWNCVTHTFQRSACDSVPAQITAGVDINEIRATVSINNEGRPLDVFLFCQKGYYLGNDSTSYAYFSADYNSLVWGAPVEGNPNMYRTVYANRGSR